jgi:hypothetical protein
VYEHETVGFVLNILYASSPIAGAIVRTILSGNTGGAFNLHSASGELVIAKALDFENSRSTT